MTTKKLLLNGWIYCLSNPSIPNLYKIGMTKKTPESRAKELYKTGLPEPFVIEFAKNVNEPMEKEKSIHKLLKNERHNSSREFFSSDLSKIKNIFSLCDGVDWEPIKESRNDEKEIDELKKEEGIEKKNRRKKREYCFDNGQRIRHKLVRQSSHWTGKWNSINKCIEFNNNEYKTLTSFAQAHSNFHGSSSKKSSINGWVSCECEIISVTGKRSWIKCNIYKNDPIWTVVNNI